MDEKEQLKELIEAERKHLDEVAELGLNHEEVYRQSKRLDTLIDEYYAVK